MAWPARPHPREGKVGDGGWERKKGTARKKQGQGQRKQIRPPRLQPRPRPCLIGARRQINVTFRATTSDTKIGVGNQPIRNEHAHLLISQSCKMQKAVEPIHPKLQKTQSQEKHPSG